MRSYATMVKSIGVKAVLILRPVKRLVRLAGQP